MSSRTNTPIWRTARTLSLMFWAGLCLAPLSALLLLIGNSGTVIKLALIAGLGSVVLIGLSVTWRKDAASVERDLSSALSDVEADTHQMIAELRSEVRGTSRGGAPVRHAVEAERPRRSEPLPAYESDYQSPPRRPEPLPAYESSYQSPPRRTEYDAVEPPRRGYAEPAAPSMQQRRTEAAYEDTGEMAQQQRRGREEYAEPAARHREPDTRGRYREPAFEFDDHSGRQQRRPEPVYDENGDMVRHTETVVTRHETTTMRSEEHEAYRNATPGPDGGVYHGSGKSSMGDKLSKFRKSRDDESEQYHARQQADSLLSGLQAEPGHEDDWRDGETMMVPQQRPSRRGYEPEDSGSRGRHTRDADPGWHAEERSAELRMGMRQSRGGPADGWNDEPRSGSWDADSRRRGRHYEEENVEPTRAISSHEAEPQPRWRDYEQPSQSSGGGSYMDQYYGRSRRG